MKKHLSLIAAAALTVGGMGIYAGAQDNATRADQAADKNVNKSSDDLKRTGQEAGDSAKASAAKLKDGLPEGVQPATKDDSEDIRDMFEGTTEAAVKVNGFDNLVQRFVDADRNRIGTFLKGDNDQKLAKLNGIVGSLNQMFEQKYGQKFDIKEDVVFGNTFKDFHIVQGEVADPKLLSNWPVQQKAKSGAIQDPNPAGIKGDTKNDGKIDVPDVKVDVKDDTKNDGKIDVPKVSVGELGKPSDKPADRNLDKGRNVAVVSFPESHGMPELYVSLIHEMPDNWKIDVPDNVDGQKLNDNLCNHLTMFAQHKDQWPTDVNEAYRMAAHHVMMAIYDMPHEKK
jgi:hypothetical protein